MTCSGAGLNASGSDTGVAPKPNAASDDAEGHARMTSDREYCTITQALRLSDLERKFPVTFPSTVSSHSRSSHSFGAIPSVMSLGAPSLRLFHNSGFPTRFIVL